MFDINITLVIQFVNFIITIVVLDFLLIRPIRGIVKKRRDLASGMLSDAERFTSEAARKLENYEAALAKTREDAAKIREERKTEAVSRENELLQTAQRDAQEFLHTSREEVRASIAETMADMEKRVPDLAALAVSRLLDTTKRPSAA